MYTICLDRSDLFTYPTNCGEIDTNVVILRLNSGSYLCFRINSGAQCNVVLMSIYETCFVTPVNTSIVAYGGSKLPLIGEVRIRMSRRDFKLNWTLNYND